MSKDDIVTIYADILQVTDAAVLADCAGEEVWLPLSQVGFFGEKGDVGVIMTLPEWLADEKGLSDGDGVRGPMAADFIGETIKKVEGACDTPCAKSCDTCGHLENFMCYSQKRGDHSPKPCEQCYLLFDDPDVIGTFTDLWIPQPPLAMMDDAQDAAPVALPPTDIHLLGNDTIEVDIALSKEDLNAVASRMADAISRKERLESELDSFRKDINKQIKDAEHDASLAALDYRMGKVKRTVDCEKMADYDTCQIVWRAKDSDEIVKRRPMTAEEKQLPLPISYPDAPRTPVGKTFGGPISSAHTCIDCASLAERADGAELPEACQTCSQADNGSADNWTPRRECRTCSHSQTQVNMPPCAWCALNVEECYRGDAEGWEWQEATSVDDKMSLDTDLESVAEHQEEPSEEGFFDPSTGAITSMISAASHDDAPMLPQ